jgi:ubiquinone/menaquinone biosynthesis C-methylase UbiE
LDDRGPFRFFGGRRHVAGVPYTLPKDDQEINRLDFQHYMLRFALKGNYAAPLGTPTSILDVGCGSGRWPLEMALLFPQANVFGVDLIPPPLDTTAGSADVRPPNYQFVAGNVLERLPFADANFDFVHQRLLIGALPAAAWPRVVQELVRVTRPGGWVELVEANIKPERGGPALDTLGDWVYTAVAQRGIDVAMCRKIGELLTNAGLSRVEQREIRLPLGQRHGRLGTMMEANHFALFNSLKGLIVALGVTTNETFDQTMEAAHKEVEQGRSAITFYVADGLRAN